jgi:hypothetical protein
VQAEFDSANYNDSNGKPAGGYATGVGLSILWQDGPLQVAETDTAPAHRREPNGAFVETVIAAVKQRIEYYQDSPFACDENEKAIMYLGLALNELNARTQRRISAGIEGTHQGN